MNSFDYIEKLWEIFTNDDELVSLLGIEPGPDVVYEGKFRCQDQAVDEFSADDLSFIAFYFFDALTTQNDYMNRGILRIDIYAAERADVIQIRQRIVELIHENLDERVRAEGQRSSGIKDIYKYRLEFTPLIFT